MKKLFALLLVTVLGSTPGVILAQEEEASAFEFSGNAALTSDYKFYGFSQSAEGWAIQGGFDIAHESGLYLGTWASSIDFVTGSTDPATIELDVYAGFASEINGLSYDVGAVRYGYPDQNDDVAVGGDLEYWEFYANFGYTFPVKLEPTVSAGIYVSPDWFGETGTSFYPKFGLDVKLPGEVGVYGKFGYLDVADINLSYTHYSVGVTRDFLGFSFDASWNDAQDECGGDDFCKGFVFTVSREF